MNWAMIADNAILIGLLNPLAEPNQFAGYVSKRLTVFAMELVPRISRAQSMDALSSQANLAGYKAVLDACIYYKHIMPMMMTAAGTLAPAKVLILGAGVAGLTGHRHGAPVGRCRLRFRCAPGGQGTGRKPGRQFCRGRGCEPTPKPPAVMPRRWMRITNAARPRRSTTR